MEDYYTNRNGGFRIQTGTVDDSGSQDDNIQYVDATGREDEQFTRVLRIQSHGMSSNPPTGAHAIAIPLGNKSDVLLMIGAEHLDHRPKNLAAGDVMLYNATNGTTIHLQGNTIAINSPGALTITAGGNLTIKAPNIALDGNVSLGGGIGSGKPAALEGTIDTGGNADVSALATKVKVT